MALEADEKPVAARPARTVARTSPGWSAWLADPRTAVRAFLGSALLFGGGRKLLQGVRARRAVAALGEPNPVPDEIEAAAEHGRAGLIDLFRLLGTAEKPEARDAAGRALARLWAKDELIVEEEKALVRRGFAVAWKARRRYPRGLKGRIPVEASYGVPFLVEGGSGVSPTNLVWSHRVLGAERAGLEEPSAWIKGPGLASFEVDPSDFPTLGPHRLALAARVRVVGLTDSWEIELPHLPFSFEFDPILTVEALLTAPDDARGATVARAIRLEPPGATDAGSRYLDLSAGLVLRDPPDLIVTTPLPCDLAHRLAIEIEGVPGQFRAGSVIVSGQGGGPPGRAEARRFPLERIDGLPPEAIDRPGERRVRAFLTADADLGWADPDVRSLWPGTLTTDWADVRVIRR
jgi:hypothetical protein